MIPVADWNWSLFAVDHHLLHLLSELFLLVKPCTILHHRFYEWGFTTGWEGTAVNLREGTNDRKVLQTNSLTFSICGSYPQPNGSYPQPNLAIRR